LIVVANKQTPRPPDGEKEKSKPEIIGYAVRPMPKRRKRLRDFRNKGEDYIRSIYAFGREMGLPAKIGCLAVLVVAILGIALVLYLVASPPGR
jgi:hypothetical protein